MTQQTVLLENHRAAGARIVDFAGWEMPVQYSGVIEESRAVRQSCGIFDVSHMAQFDFSGEGCDAAINDVVSNDWSTTDIGNVAYALLLNENGGVIDDVMGYHLDTDKWLIVGNASRAEADQKYFSQHLQKYFLGNRYDNQAMLAIQGPEAQKVLLTLTDTDLADLKHRHFSEVTIAGARGLLARGGYTGSDGFEFILSGKDAPQVWDAVVSAGALPCGLGARDVLRLEAGLPLYGHELREEWTPFESGVKFAVKMDKSTFVGKDALVDKENPTRRIKGLKMQARAIPREGYAVLQDGGTIGEITSGTISPTLDAGIAFAMLPVELELGDAVDVQIRKKTQLAVVVKKAFLKE